MLPQDLTTRPTVHSLTLVNWERSNTRIEVRFGPAIIALVGFNLLLEARTRGVRMRRRARLSRGLSWKRLADLAGIDESTETNLETDVANLSPGLKGALLRVLALREWSCCKNQGASDPTRVAGSSSFAVFRGNFDTPRARYGRSRACRSPAWSPDPASPRRWRVALCTFHRR